MMDLSLITGAQVCAEDRSQQAEEKVTGNCEITFFVTSESLAFL